jgi:hypothetical protein
LLQVKLKFPQDDHAGLRRYSSRSHTTTVVVACFIEVQVVLSFSEYILRYTASIQNIYQPATSITTRVAYNCGSCTANVVLSERFDVTDAVVYTAAFVVFSNSWRDRQLRWRRWWLIAYLTHEFGVESSSGNIPNLILEWPRGCK